MNTTVKLLIVNVFKRMPKTYVISCVVLSYGTMWALIYMYIYIY